MSKNDDRYVEDLKGGRKVPQQSGNLSEQDEALARKLGELRLEKIGVRSQMIVFEQLASGNYGSRAAQLQMQFESAMDEYQKQFDKQLTDWSGGQDFLSLSPQQS